MEARLPRSSPRVRGKGPRTGGQPSTLPLRLLAVIGAPGILIGLGFLAYVILGFRFGSSAPANAGHDQILYALFGPTADRIVRSDPNDPERRIVLFEAAHAREYGIVAALAPDGAGIAYTLLPPSDLTPTPDSPAELWVATLEGAEPLRLAEGLDLLVRPMWASDGRSVVVRRSSGPAPYELLRISVATGAETPLAASDSALFPVGLAPSGDLYYTEVGFLGSSLAVVTPGGANRRIAQLSSDLTRDWTLSPEGTRVAFLALSDSFGRASSRVHVLDIASGEVELASPEGVDAFGPAWSTDGRLTYGQLSSNSGGTGIRLDSQATLPSPARGFDVPLAWSPSGAGLAVRSFDGVSAHSPGRATLTVISPGGRRTIATGEVTFIGWTYR
jgi:hypothetical protein